MPGLLEIFRSQPFTSEIRTLAELLEKGVNARDEQGMTPLLAISNRRKDAVIFTTSESGAQTGNIWLGMVRELIAMKANVNLADNNGVTPLIAAVDCGEKEIALALIAAKADLSQGENEGCTPLMYAVASGPEITRLLLERKADVNAVDAGNGTAVMIAASRNAVEIVKMLHEYGADVNVTDNHKRTALTYAKSEEVKNLLKAMGAK